VASLLPSKAPPSAPWQARRADSDYGVSAEPNWREVDWPAHLHRVEVDGVPVNYVDIGEGDEDPVVMIHGLSGQWQNWLENIPRLAQERRVLAPDLPGFGLTPMPPEEISVSGYGRCIEGFCRALDLGEVALVGNSLGGFTAAETAIQFPERVSRLVLLSPAGITSANVAKAPTHVVGRIAGALTAVTAARHRTMARRPLARHLALGLVVRYPPKIAADVAWEAMMKGAGKPGFQQALMASVRYDYRDRLGDIRVPTLIIWGENDSIISVDDAHEYERLIPDSRKIVMEDTGHVPMIERPQAVNDVLVEFLSETGPAEDREPVDHVSERR